MLTISLVTFNGAHWLAGCLNSVAALTRSGPDDIELIVLDNASTDGTLELLRGRVHAGANLLLIESDTNLGYAAAHNRVINKARSEFVLLLNQDVELDPAFADHALAAFAGRPRAAAVQGRIRRLAADGSRLDTLDSTGLTMGRDRRFMSRSQGQPDGPAQQVAGAVFGADGPAPVYRRAALLDARLPRTGGGWEVLDEDFFMYKEDVDLAWRLRLLGWRARYEPRALAWHAGGASRSAGNGAFAVWRSQRRVAPDVRALWWRNQRLMQIKNESLTAYLRDLPWILGREVITLVTDPRRLAALPATLKGVSAALQKRRYLHRVVARRARSSPRAIKGG